MVYNQNYITYIFKKIAKKTYIAFFCLWLPIIFCLPKICLAQALLDCSDPSIASTARSAGNNCIMSYCPYLKNNDANNISTNHPNCVNFLCSDPAITVIRPGINCAMALCSNLPAGHIAKPGLNCVMPDCKTISGNPIVSGGNANCSYMGLPLCSLINEESRRPRINCADLIDLQLSKEITTSLGHDIDLGKDAVADCNDITNPNPSAAIPLIAGVDYAVHNRDCIRFCDQIPRGESRNPGVNCAIRKCHQLSAATKPIPEGPNRNCILENCNLLTVDELDDPKFNDTSKKFCEGSGIKCYQFSEEQLPFVKPATMCQLHNCPLSAESGLSCGVDDTFHFNEKDKSYLTSYIKYINAGLPLSSSCLLSVNNCGIVANRPYRCLSDDKGHPMLNPACDTEGKNSVCDNNGFCYKKIDCSLPLNAKEQECLISSKSNPNSTSKKESEDSFDSWFYRPVPPSNYIYKVVERFGLGKEYISHNSKAEYYDERLCYSEQNLKNLKTDLGFNNAELVNDSISPGLCRNDGGSLFHLFRSIWEFISVSGRGTGYTNLCGTNNELYHAPDLLKTAYIKSYIRSDKSKNYITVCLRFKNSSATDEKNSLQACGKRECKVLCDSIYGCKFQVCGDDYCQELEVNEINHKECEMNDELFISSPKKPCLKTIDDNLRVRAVQYGNRICAFMDVKGHTGEATVDSNSARPHFFSGNETLDDDSRGCISGVKLANGKCVGGYNTNKNQESTTVYRTLFLIPYIGDAINPNSEDRTLPHGYYDVTGRFFSKQQCAIVPFKIGPPKLYNLANRENSSLMFYPPVYITSVRNKRGGYSVTNGYTDFFNPEIEVGFGDGRQLLSLQEGCIDYSSKAKNGIECNNQSKISPAKSEISATIKGIKYTTNIFVAKEYEQETLTPLLCLYQEIHSINKRAINKIDCVKRNYPEISGLNNKLALSLDQKSTFNDFKVIVNYLISKNSDGTDYKKLNNISFGPILSDANSCNNKDLANAEMYLMCVKRDECSKLNIECLENEINLHRAKIENKDTDSYLAIKKSCDEQLLPACNLKKNIFDHQKERDIDNIKLAYGWFNEACIVSGFQTKLKKIIAYKLPRDVMGKCLVASNSPYLIDNNPNTNCDEGGNAPNCNCVEYNDEIQLSDNQLIRFETWHEAGLCVNLPKAQICPAIIHNIHPNTNQPSDLDYKYQSLGHLNYNSENVHNANGVDISHKYRSFGSVKYSIPVAGHADFPLTLALNEQNKIIGECKGYFKNEVVNNVELSPTMTCIKTDNNQAKWSNQVEHPCVRYSCNEVIAGNPNSYGIYSNNYSKLEIGDDRGLKNGFANWPKYTKTNDFLENVTAKSCITGFKPNHNKLPNRSCDQLGSYLEINNPCIRITCPAISPRLPENLSDRIWNSWQSAGGATWQETKASRSTADIQPESIATGACNNDIGYFQVGLPPTRGCDHLGHWQEVRNSCKTGCFAVDEENSSENDGFAIWRRVNIPVNATSVAVSAVSCNNGYVVNPYSNNQLPTRTCDYKTSKSGIRYSIWSKVENSCVNQCPSAEDDPIHGVTTHDSSNGKIKIYWQKTNLSQYAYASDQDDLNASHFQPGRNNHHYLLRRKCSNKGKWLEPEAMCATSDGMIGNAWYQYNDTTTSLSAIPVGVRISANRCVDTYSPVSHDLPVRECKFNNNRNIDQVYLELFGGDCQKGRCQISNNQSFGNAKYSSASSSTSDYYLQGTKISLRCKEGYGHQENATGEIRKITHNPEIDICQSNYYNWLPDTNRIESGPTITCTDNGEWTNLENDCTSCKSCNNQSEVLGKTSIYLSDNTKSGAPQACLYNSSTGLYYNCDARSNHAISFDNFILSHLQSKVGEISLTASEVNNQLLNWFTLGYMGTKSDFIYIGIKAICYDGRIFSRMIVNDENVRSCKAVNINFDSSSYLPGCHITP